MAHSSNGFRDAEVIVNLTAIEQNLSRLRTLVGAVPIAATIKADAYGLGVAQVAPVLSEANVSSFFVASIAEGVELRAIIGWTPDIYVLNGFQKNTAEILASNRLLPVLNSLEQIKSFAEFAQVSDVNKAAVHIDTGMNRLGLEKSEVDTLIEDPSPLTNIELSCWMSHLACGDEPDHPMNEQQRIRLSQTVQNLPDAPICLANSAGCLMDPSFHFDLVRPGLALYGGNPIPSEPNKFMPVLTVKAPILRIRTVKAGESVGYGASFTAKSSRQIAIVAIGYADGLLRILGDRGTISVNGQAVPIVGRVSMDLLALDISESKQIQFKEGDMIEIIGPNNPIDVISSQAGTVSYEILTSLRQRSVRTYIKS